MGDVEEFTAFVEARQAKLLQLSRALTGDRQLGEDLAQATLDRLWPRWAKVSAAGDPWPYTQSIAVSLATTWRRRRWRHAEVLTGAPSDSVTTDDVEQAAERLTVATWLATLPARQRAVIVLRFLSDLSVEQTASRLPLHVRNSEEPDRQGAQQTADTSRAASRHRTNRGAAMNDHDLERHVAIALRELFPEPTETILQSRPRSLYRPARVLAIAATVCVVAAIAVVTAVLPDHAGSGHHAQTPATTGPATISSAGPHSTDETHLTLESKVQSLGERSYPDVYGGMVTIDKGAKLAVYLTKLTPQIKASFETLAPKNYLVFRSTPRSLRTIEQLQSSVAGQRATLLRSGVNVVQIGADIALGKLDIGVESVTTTARYKLNSMFGADALNIYNVRPDRMGRVGCAGPCSLPTAS